MEQRGNDEEFGGGGRHWNAAKVVEKKGSDSMENGNQSAYRDFGRWGALQTVRVNPAADPAVTGNEKLYILLSMCKYC